MRLLRSKWLILPRQGPPMMVDLGKATMPKISTCFSVSFTALSSKKIYFLQTV